MHFIDKGELNGAKHYRKDQFGVDDYLPQEYGAPGSIQGKQTFGATQRDYDLTKVARKITRHLDFKYKQGVRFNPLPMQHRKEGNIAELRVKGKVIKQYDYVPTVFTVEDDIQKLTGLIPRI